MCAHHEKEGQGHGYNDLTGVAWSILVMGLSLAAVIILWVWFGYIGPTFSEDILANQQRTLRENFGHDKVAQIAGSLGARVLRENAETGETDAVDFARTSLKNAGCEAVLIVPGDMPLVRSADIELVLSQVPAGQNAPFALLVPSHDRLGTNALLLAPPDIIKLRFGYDSFTYHLSQVSAQGLPIRCFDNRHIALDIDEPRDLERFLSGAVDKTQTLETLRRFSAEQSGAIRRVGEA